MSWGGQQRKVKSFNWNYDDESSFAGFLQEACAFITLERLLVLWRCLARSNFKQGVLTVLRYISCIHFLFQLFSFQERRRVWLQSNQRRGSPESCWKRSIHHPVLQRLICHDRQGGGGPDGCSHLWQAPLSNQHVPLHLDQQGNQPLDQWLLQGHHRKTKVSLPLSAFDQNDF